MNMDFEQLLKQEVQKAARQDYEESLQPAKYALVFFSLLSFFPRELSPSSSR